MKSWSSRQASIALSSGEPEFHAAAKGATEALGVKSSPTRADAEAARTTASRQGVGKIRHLEVRLLWLQDLVRSWSESGMPRLVECLSDASASERGGGGGGHAKATKPPGGALDTR